jgi:molybdenum cofactor guanylyltransferase
MDDAVAGARPPATADTGAGRARVLVAVLAGGLATRMGTTKAWVDLCGRPLISYPLAAARAAGLDAVVVAKRASRLPPLRERVVHEPDSPRHPLCGIVAALRHAGAPVIAVGCDMPFVSAGMLTWLASAGGETALGPAGETASSRLAKAAVSEVEGRLQPFPALYPPADLPKLERALERECSLQTALQTLAPRVIAEDELAALGEPRRLCFSVNAPRDLQTARRWMGS